ncbi:MAG: UDPGP type 1 family protein, partial [Clostridia bacterium]|nr:UDPGP type 1 family protein [Clostridia bacterium]
MEVNLEEAKIKLGKYGQEQVLKFYDELSDEGKDALLEQIDKTDMEVISAIDHRSELIKKGVITPLDAMELDDIEAGYDRYKNTGVKAIK